MPIKANAEKALRQSKKRAARNEAALDTISFLTKKVRKSIHEKDKTGALEHVKKTIKAIDKAQGRGILKLNTAARKKSRLMKRANAFLKA